MTGLKMQLSNCVKKAQINERITTPPRPYKKHVNREYVKQAISIF